MKLLQDIVVALDFGPQTDSVIKSAKCTARAFCSELHLLHVLPTTEDTSAADAELVEMAQQGAEARLQQIQSQLQEQDIGVADTKVARGSAFDQIIKYADELDANVIIVGSCNDQGPDARRVSTTTERLYRKSAKPVWVVAPDADREPRSLLCPIDYSAPSVRALKNAIHLARGFGAELSVMHAVRPPAPISGLTAPGDAVQEPKRLEATTSDLDNFLEDFDFRDISWRKLVRTGSPADVIVRIADEVAADLIVMGSVGRTGLSRILLGSVAVRVAQRLPCSMIMVKAEDAIKLKIDDDLADLKTHYLRGCELLENGFLDEARRQFASCTQTADFFAPAWHGLADVYQSQDETDRAERCRETARKIEEALAWRQVEADIRRNHPLWNKHAK